MTDVIEREELPADIKIEIDALAKSLGQAKRDQNRELAEELIQKIWDRLPEPKLGWEFYSNIFPRGFMNYYREVAQYDKALYWLDITRESYGPSRDDVIEFYAAAIYYDMGDKERALKEFDRQYKAFGQRPFTDEGSKYRKYLDIYLEETKNG